MQRESDEGGRPPHEVRHYLDRFSDEVIGHGYSLPSRLNRLRDLPLIACYSQQLKAEKKSAHTSKSYLVSARKFVQTPLPTDVQLTDEEVARMTMLEAVAHLDPNNGRLDNWLQSISNYSASTVAARLSGATHLLKWLGHAIPEWVVRPQRNKRLPKTLTKDGLRQVLRVASESENPATEVIVVLLLETGMRVSELCALDMDDVDLEDLSAKVWSGKGRKDRSVFFTERSCEMLNRWLRYRAGVSIKKNEGDALFVNRRGSRITQRNVQKMMDALAEAADMPRSRLTPHTLRHNFATGLLERGADIVTIQRLLGHSDINTTRVYLDITDQTMREVYNRAQESDIFGDFN